jgi:hypothetical protein
MPRSCGTVQNFFRQVDFYPALRRNQAMLQGMSAAAAREGLAAARTFPDRIPVVVHILHATPDDDLSDQQVASHPVRRRDRQPGSHVLPRRRGPAGQPDERHHAAADQRGRVPDR